MPMRHRYGYNSQVVNWGGLYELVPLGYIDVCPGEIVQGSVSLAFRSQPTKLAIDTRFYVDAFAFYMPYRLTWQGFPSWVAAETASNIFEAGAPIVTNLFPFNFESRFTAPATAAAATMTANTPWLRSFYTEVWNRFFKSAEQSGVGLTTNSPLICSQRPSTLETKVLLGSAAVTDTTVLVPVTGIAGATGTGNMSLNQFRYGIAQDNFRRMRAWYGSKYVDYLAALGVEVPWSLLEEPGLLSQVHKDWRFQRATQTAPTATGAPNNVVGQVAGQFFTQMKLNIPRTFVPEHGHIGMFAVTRADGVYTGAPVPPQMSKVWNQAYWSPEYEAMLGAQITGFGPSNQAWPGALPSQVFTDQFGTTNDYSWRTLQYEEYRTGLNYNREPTNGPQYAGMAAGPYNTASPGYKYIHPSSTYFDNNFTQGTTQGFQVVAQNRLTRFSPVRHVDRKLKLS